MIAQGWLKLVALGIVGAIVLTYIVSQDLRFKHVPRLISQLFLAYAIAHCVFILVLWLNHIAFPLNLEAMELLRLQHVQRLLRGLVLYPEPSSNFVALAYNPLSYMLSAPFVLAFGETLFSLRLFAIFGILGTAGILFRIVYQETRSSWWGMMTVGLFAASYVVMDTYLDMAHADSWLLLTLLLGCYNLQRDRTLIGIGLLIVSFWIKQHGVLFAIAALLYLYFKRGWRKVIFPSLLVLLLIPGLYLAMPSSWLGPKFHYFTWEVPRRWSQVNLETLGRWIRYIAQFYLPMAVFSAIAYRSGKLRDISIWAFMLPFALMTGLMGSLDIGSNNNVFIPMATWLILVGTLGLYQQHQKRPSYRRWGIVFAALGMSFVLLLYNPASVLVPPQAQATYRDFVGYLRGLQGQVYIPWIGQLQDGYRLSPGAHWVPMEDMVRGRAPQPSDRALIQRLMQPLTQPKGKAFLMLNSYPLKEQGILSFLSNFYVLEQDTGDRFKTLSTLPRRFNIAYPRYLYRYDPQAARQLPAPPQRR